MGRGDVRGLLLVALLDGPTHGYELIRRLEEASGGAWSPSPGSVYPTLQLLADEELVTVSTDGGRKTYAVTTTGRTAGRAAAKLPRPWDAVQTTATSTLRDTVHAVHAATKQVGTVGTPAQVERATEILRDARRQLYALLAED